MFSLMSGTDLYYFYISPNAKSALRLRLVVGGCCCGVMRRVALARRRGGHKMQ